VKLQSLSARLLAASAVLLPVFLGLTGVGLERAFRGAIEAAEVEQLKVQSYLILGAAELEGDRIVLPPVLSEPRYDQLGSGLYARIEDEEGTEVWRSRSAELLAFSRQQPHLKAGVREFGEVQAEDTWLFYYRYGLVWELEGGREVPFELLIWHHQAPYRAQIASYRASLSRSLVLVGVLLVGVQLAIWRWGLRPLRTLAADLERVQHGEVERLTGDYPREVQGVAENLNHLLASEHGRRERYRNTLSNLAHSLKTPLAVLRGALDTGASPEALRRHCEEELERMGEIVAHQLSRAQRRGERPLGASVAIAPVVQRLTEALAKVYREKSPRFRVEITDGLQFRGDDGDLMEMLGNLLDNCCKYGGTNIAIEARRAGEGVEIAVSDDGSGIAESERARILERGARADRSAPGHGIGLSVVHEIATSYGGTLGIESLEGSGVAFVLRF
jgi:two-component system sensor histidine kinase PhoQ